MGEGSKYYIILPFPKNIFSAPGVVAMTCDTPNPCAFGCGNTCQLLICSSIIQQVAPV